jgi:hypothetical protein
VRTVLHLLHLRTGGVRERVGFGALPLSIEACAAESAALRGLMPLIHRHGMRAAVVLRTLCGVILTVFSSDRATLTGG